MRWRAYHYAIAAFAAAYLWITYEYEWTSKMHSDVAMFVSFVAVVASGLAEAFRRDQEFKHGKNR